MPELDKYHQRLSRFLSLVLRHNPAAAGVTLDKQGWVSIEALLHGCNMNGHLIDRHQLDHIVENNDKKRFTIEGNRIRAAQGHSVDIELSLTPVKPPTILYHGTSTSVVDMVYFLGIQKMKRNHVHLSADKDIAMTVGKRHGKPVVVPVHAGVMYEDGFQFFLSDNGVWLTEGVLPCYLDFRRLIYG